MESRNSVMVLCVGFEEGQSKYFPIFHVDVGIVACSD